MPIRPIRIPAAAVAAHSATAGSGRTSTAGIRAVAPSAKIAKNGPAGVSRHRSASSEAPTAKAVSTATRTGAAAPHWDRVTPTATPADSRAAPRSCCRVRARPPTVRPYMPVKEPKTA